MALPSVVLPQPDSPTKPSVSPVPEFEGHAIDRLALSLTRTHQHAAANGEVLLQVLDFEQAHVSARMRAVARTQWLARHSIKAGRVFQLLRRVCSWPERSRASGSAGLKSATLARCQGWHGACALALAVELGDRVHEDRACRRGAGWRTSSCTGARSTTRPGIHDHDLITHFRQ